MTYPAPPTCPRCGGRLLWCDGLPSPDVTYVREGDGQRIVGCANCMGARALGSVASSRPAKTVLGTPVTTTPDPRPLREILATEGGKVVSFLSDGLDVIDGVAKLWDRLKPRRP